jgi:hypothetical protein
MKYTYVKKRYFLMNAEQRDCGSVVLSRDHYKKTPFQYLQKPKGKKQIRITENIERK